MPDKITSNLIIAGVYKCGMTPLYGYLGEHPEEVCQAEAVLAIDCLRFIQPELASLSRQVLFG